MASTSGMTAMDAPLAPEPFASLSFAGLKFTPLSVDQTVGALAQRAADAPFAVFVTPNAEHAYLRRHDAEFRALGDGCWLSTNDSRVLRRAAAFGGLDLQFAPGAYVVQALFDRVIAPDDALTVIGGTPDLVARLKAKYGLTRVSQHVPPMGFIHDDAAVAQAIEFVVRHPARFVFVAMGPPQSEKFCARVAAAGGATGIGLCIGSSLSVITGTSDPAPAIMEQSGTVWLYRLAREPKRLWRRYLRGFYGLGLGLADAARCRLGRGRPGSDVRASS
ncbi:MAG: WecB/TagA/CpsF family glycosyltransferase [Caulobacteraceae bacterium]